MLVEVDHLRSSSQSIMSRTNTFVMFPFKSNPFRVLRSVVVHIRGVLLPESVFCICFYCCFRDLPIDKQKITCHRVFFSRGKTNMNWALFFFLVSSCPKQQFQDSVCFVTAPIAGVTKQTLTASLSMACNIP